MKWILFGMLLVAATAVARREINTRAPVCDPKACKLPECRCSGTDIPGGLEPEDTPQFFTITFDDGINVNNIDTFRRVLYNRRNSNGCPAGATFYISHEYTDYQGVNELYNKGFEIALHSITHTPEESYWANATYGDLVKEFAYQKIMMSHFANIPYETIKGIRHPFIQMSGDASFKMMADYNLLYDCSWPTLELRNPGLWPYTLHYMSSQDCIIPPCPISSIPGPWVMPIIPWLDLKGSPCSFVDACFWKPNSTDEDAWYDFIVKNFEEHYEGNRSPFGFFVHEWFLSNNLAIQKALIKFMDYINSLEDVFMVNSAEVIDWVKNPLPIEEYKQQACKRITPTLCTNTNCGPLSTPYRDVEYWLQICTTCPNVYPWLDNPLGQ